MRGVLLLVVLSTLAWLGSSTPIDRERQLINKPTKEMMFRLARSPYEGAVKGGAPKNPATGLRKGEYVCGNRVCKLRPGEVPRGCNGVCQYPLAPGGGFH